MRWSGRETTSATRRGRFRYRCCRRTSADPVHWARLSEIIRPSDQTSVQDEAARVAVTISNIRARLRRMFGLAADVDPIPCVVRGNGPTGGKAAWTIWIPPECVRDRRVDR